MTGRELRKKEIWHIEKRKTLKIQPQTLSCMASVINSTRLQTALDTCGIVNAACKLWVHRAQIKAHTFISRIRVVLTFQIWPEFVSLRHHYAAALMHPAASEPWKPSTLKYVRRWRHVSSVPWRVRAVRVKLNVHSRYTSIWDADECSGSRCGCFITECHGIGGWVVPRAGLDKKAKRRELCAAWNTAGPAHRQCVT
jgi:hypothetical protein